MYKARIFVLFIIPFHAIAASYDCSKALTHIEKTICTNPQLSELDTALDTAYTTLYNLIDTEKTKQLTIDQQHWLRNIRNRCNDTACIEKAYHTRINELDPFTDNKITCEEMKKHKELIFNNRGIDLGSGTGSPIEVDYDCNGSLSTFAFTKKLLEIAEVIRGEGGPSLCTGTIVHAQWRYYYFALAAAGIAPQTIEKQEHNGFSERPLDAYFKQWSEQSPYNFQLYNSFIKEAKYSQTSLAKYYQQHFKLPHTRAIAISRNAISIILDRATGAFPLGDYQPSSKVVLTASDQSIGITKLKAMLANKDRTISEFDIYLALKVALLHNRQLAYIKLLTNNLTSRTLVEFGKLDEPLLAFAIQNAEHLQHLLDKGTPIDAQNAFGKTTLFYAIGFGNHQAAKTLIEHGANVNHTYKSAKKLRLIDNNQVDECIFPNLLHTRRTPLMHAAQNSDVQMIKLLLNKGAKLSSVDEIGFNALDYAVMGNNKINESFLRSLGLRPGNHTN